MGGSPTTWLCLVLAAASCTVGGTLSWTVEDRPLTPRCTATASEIRAVAPDGEILLGTVDAYELRRATGESVASWPAEGIATPVALGAGAVAFSRAGRLFVKTATTETEVGVPSTIDSFEEICGDPRIEGAVLVAREDDDVVLYWRRRSDWWRTTPFSPALGTYVGVMRSAGRCMMEHDEMWFVSSSGLVRVTPETTTRWHEGTAALAYAQDFGALALQDGRLRTLASSEGAWVSLLGDINVSSMSGGDRGLWLVSDGALEHWSAGVRSRIGTDASDVHADLSGGAWFRRGGDLCRVEFEQPPTLTPRAFAFLTDATVQANRGVDAIVTVDGAEIHNGALAQGQMLTLPLSAAGWHVLRVETDAGSERIPFHWSSPQAPTFERDIAPLATRSCALAGCHDGSDAGRVPLTSYADFRTSASQIRTRVVDLANMPPRTVPFTTDERLRFYEWFQQGMVEHDP